ncbi:hypothetical protein CAOG_01204 [Capsaspora owczarzaki ATCC 30864]|uniref:hypothetical protein n=1 Tax=Capsaspora owczarzaki (strain ATCC 30864) TaxID=595528 RepID=UPI0001FE5399|nr:hypothetical protein CAOG_01204 [Capsaspora owczarzaki ATCC 30864]|eukprot:XP_004349701.1 hypothetical protein CAOG_01204 [Capsaspora owczarzaki ATCC 30864]
MSDSPAPTTAPVEQSAASTLDVLVSKLMVLKQEHMDSLASAASQSNEVESLKARIVELDQELARSSIDYQKLRDAYEDVAERLRLSCNSTFELEAARRDTEALVMQFRREREELMARVTELEAKVAQCQSAETASKAAFAESIKEQESTQSLAFQLFKRNAEGTIRTLHEKNKTMSTQLLQLQESGTVQSQEMFRKKWQQALALLTAERDAHAATRAELAHGRRPKAVVGSATSSAAATSATLSDSTPQVNKVPHITRKKPRLQQPAPVAANPVVTVSSSAPAKDNWAIEGDMDIDLS